MYYILMYLLYFQIFSHSLVFLFKLLIVVALAVQKHFGLILFYLSIFVYGSGVISITLTQEFPLSLMSWGGNKFLDTAFITLTHFGCFFML